LPVEYAHRSIVVCTVPGAVLSTAPFTAAAGLLGSTAVCLAVAGRGAGPAELLGGEKERARPLALCGSRYASTPARRRMQGLASIMTAMRRAMSTKDFCGRCHELGMLCTKAHHLPQCWSS
jgi:hypothetical protein